MATAVRRRTATNGCWRVRGGAQAAVADGVRLQQLGLNSLTVLLNEGHSQHRMLQQPVVQVSLQLCCCLRNELNAGWYVDTFVYGVVCSKQCSDS
jgi:hypothetical protein